MIVCVCHRVSDRDIAREVAQGCASFDELQDNTRIGTGCGACREFAEETFAAHAGSGCCGGHGRQGCAQKPPVAATGAAVRECERLALVAGN